ncbi:NTE family protein RssA [Rubripirellula tenax]|uniref:NTE family protein RssA n=1 Tax=Rubripirellula tenax TaxID=2528015 RepID=A0A5C6EIE3_9BACT|nr:patatin-like phospholipase family protein [Rubripirellula tenax]TWU47421.1 NTE family protein RssA [Rubripirellula tenax]
MVNFINRFFPQAYSHADRGLPSRRQAVVALGGGGARGLAHLGAIEGVLRTGISIERIVGVSAGSLIGALYAVEGDIRRAESVAIGLLNSPEFQLGQQILCGAAPPTDDESTGGTFGWYSRIRKILSAHRKLTRAVTSSSLISDAPLRDAIAGLLPDCDISDLSVPTSIVAADLLSGQRVVLERGPLRLAVQASSAIPGIFPPVRWDDLLLCDIGMVETVPAMIAKSYADDLTIAVDVGQGDTRVDACDTALDVMMRMDDVCQRLMRRYYLDAADVVIRPNIGTRAWFDFSHPNQVIEEGRHAAIESLGQFERSNGRKIGAA